MFKAKKTHTAKKKHQVLRRLPNELAWLLSKIKVATRDSKAKHIQSTKIEENNL